MPYRIRNETTNDLFLPVPGTEVETRVRRLREQVPKSDGEGVESVIFHEEYDVEKTVAVEDLHVPPSLPQGDPGVVLVEDDKMDRLKNHDGFQAMSKAGYVSVAHVEE